MDTAHTSEEPAPPTPLPIPPGAERVVLFGGSFDPPTLAHTAVADLAREHGAGPDAWLVLVPAARSPHKSHQPAPDHHRVEMLHLAAASLANAAVWTDEIDRADDPSFFIDTLRRARDLAPDARLWFVIGADQAAEFHRWSDAHEILRLAQPIVVLREPLGSIESLEHAIAETGFWTVEELAEWCGAVTESPTIPGSSSEVRQAFANADARTSNPAELLDPSVFAYITDHAIYRD